MKLELRPVGAQPTEPEFRQVVWSPAGSPSDVQANVGPWLTEIGSSDPSSIDLVRIAVCAYLADRLERRGEGYSRTIEIHVQLMEPDRWQPLSQELADLLRWISNDDWYITMSADGQSQPAVLAVGDGGYERVALLSGGLDSFCGAVLNSSRTLYLSHTDNPTVTASQRRSWGWLVGLSVVDGRRTQIDLREREGTTEKSTRTRSFLFYALAVAVARANGVDIVEVPENGFTSINVPLSADRGGVLTTRSTHPWTIAQLRSLLGGAGIQVEIANPYEWLTKGELIQQAAEATTMDFAAGAAVTLSCAKLDGRTFKGGNQNYNCGSCVACLTRRGGFLSSGIEDRTPYLFNSLPMASRDALRHKRRADIESVRSAVVWKQDFDDFDLVGTARFPDGYDLDRGAALVRRGFAELAEAVDTH